MRIKIGFTADIIVHGGRIPRDTLVEALVEWLENSDTTFTDTFVDFIPEEIEFDQVEMLVNQIKVGS